MQLLKEPLLHFLLIGAALFGVFGLVNRGDSRAEADTRIVVSAGRIEQLARVFAKTWQRPPTAQELKGLIDNFVLEEVYYRQAVALGLDRDDTVIRRRLRQKLEFLTEDAVASAKPTDEQLAAYLAAHADRFRREPTFTFRQIYINPEKHRDDLEDDVAQRLAALRSGRPASSDSGLLPEVNDQASGPEVDSMFGTGFSRRLSAISPGEWQGPVESGLGLHLVRLESRTEGTVPELAEIRSVVEREWANDQRQQGQRKLDEALLGQYEVVVEWPPQRGQGSLPVTSNEP